MIDELVSRVDRYLDEESSLEDLERWFYDQAFDLERRYSGPIVDLFHEIEGILAEASSAGWGQPDVRSELEIALQEHRQHPRVVRVHEAGWRASLLALLREEEEIAV